MSWAVSIRVPVAADEVAIDCGPSNVLVWMGANGVGKTTALRAVLGLCRSAGVVRVGGVTWQWEGDALRPEQRRCAYAPQSAGLFGGQSVRRNVMAALRGSDRRQRADAWLERFGLLQRGGAEALSLSRGEQQQVALIRALAAVDDGAHALVLDEPFAHLSDDARVRFEAALAAHAVAGTPLLIVTHDDALATRLGGERVRLTRSPRGPQQPPER